MVISLDLSLEVNLSQHHTSQGGGHGCGVQMPHPSPISHHPALATPPRKQAIGAARGPRDDDAARAPCPSAPSSHTRRHPAVSPPARCTSSGNRAAPTYASSGAQSAETTMRERVHGGMKRVATPSAEHERDAARRVHDKQPLGAVRVVERHQPVRLASSVNSRDPCMASPAAAADGAARRAVARGVRSTRRVRACREERGGGRGRGASERGRSEM